MKAQRDWCGLIPWLLAASLFALQAQFAGAAETPAGPSITINRGESYVIKGVSPNGDPVVTPIDNPGSLIVNKQPDGSILVLGADAGIETVKVTTADGKVVTYTITVRSNTDPKNPLSPASSAAATPLDEGSGPAETAAPKNGTASAASPSGSTETAAAEPKDTGATPASAPATSGPASSNSTPKATDASASTDSAAPATAPAGSGIAPGATKIVTEPESSASPTKPADAPSAGPAPASTDATAAPSTAKPGLEPDTSATAPKTDAGAASAESGKPNSGDSTAPLGISRSGEAIPSQAASAASEKGIEKFSADPRVEEEPVTPLAGRHNLPEDAITLMFGTSRIFDFPSRIKRVSIADSEIADLQVVNPHQLMLIGHKPGFTTLAVWDDQGRYEERQVRIEQTGHQQVLLNCTVAEVNRSKVENQGINLSVALSRAGVSVVGLPGSVATPYTPQTQLSSSGSGGSTSGGILPFGGQLIPMLLSSGLTYGVATDNHQLLTQSFFRFLEDHQLGRILAEPHILANSGQEAKFLSGGEIPIVIAQALNTSVVFKQFGTSVVFIPTVIGKRDIELVVKPEVSKPDFSQGVQLAGFTVPAFVTRRAETVVRMKENQTLIIAGLILRDRRSQIDKVPYLGDLPWAGALFRTTQYEDVKTELVMSVTPQIVNALPTGAEVDYPEKDHLTSQEIRTGRLSEPDVTRPRF